MHPTKPDEKRAAFMDIGTNSVRMLIVGITGDTYTVLSKQKEMVRLGEGEFDDGMLKPEAVERAALVCGEFAEMARGFEVDDILAVATSALREADNRAEFIERLHEEAALDVRVISGPEEARLIYLGVSRSIHLESTPALFIDIGGGSTELIVGDNVDYESLDSVQLGAIRLANLFFLKDENGPVPRSRYKLIRQYVYNRAIRVIQRLAGKKYAAVVGSSGTIENLADIAARMFHGRKRVPEDLLTRAQLKTVISHLCELPLEKRRQVHGINANRADIIIAGAAVLDGLMKALHVDELRISGRGVQHGLLVDYLASNQHDLHAKPYTVRERSVLKLGRSCRFDEQHARHVADLALELFDSGKEAGLHALGEWERELLGHAALLHDVGMFVAYNSHEAHTYYLIRHANLLGFDQTETAIMASTAFFHRKRFPRKKHPEFATLDKRSGQIVRVLATFLRMAESLDRSHTNAIDHVRLLSGDEEIVLETRSEKGTQLEEWNIPQRAEEFERVFEKTLVVKKL